MPTALALSAGCLSKGTGDTGGETHWQKRWLAGCVSSAQCDAGLECIGHLCSVPCVDDSQCEQTEAATCQEVGPARACVVPERLGCSASTLACDDQHAGWFCLAGAATGCAQPISACDEGTWREGTIDTCRDRVVTASTGLSATWEVAYGDRPTPVDVLFVVDNSVSMAAAQRKVAAAVPGFLEGVGARANAEVRAAVTTVDRQCEVNGTTIFAAKGRFNDHPAVAFPPPAQEAVRVECASDADCPAAVCAETGECDSDEADWSCRTVGVPSCVVNPNGSINTRCRRRCATDEDCPLVDGATAICQKPSANPDDWGCLVPPPTQACPETVPAVLEGPGGPTLAACAAVVPVTQEKCFKFEQGLESMRAALDRDGPNSAQALAFHRDGVLVVVIVSDEDDCSTHEAIGEMDYETCALLPTTDEDGPLVPVHEYVTFLEAQRRPGAVLAMAIVGQSLEDSPSAIAADEAAYVASKSDPKTCFHQTSICTNGSITADLGSRYAELVRALGANGSLENLCADNSVQSALDRLGANVEATLKRACAPRDDLSGIVVKLAHAGELIVLTEGDGDDAYRVVSDAAECEHRTAIVPNRAIAPGDVVIFQLP